MGPTAFPGYYEFMPLCLLNFEVTYLTAWINCLTISLILTCGICNFSHNPSQLPISPVLTSSLITCSCVFVAAISGYLSMSGILFPYSKIGTSIQMIPYQNGGKNLHNLWVSTLHYSLILWNRPWRVLDSAVLCSPRKGEGTSMIYTVVTSMLNSLTSSLRNRDI